ncbi:hypothetical protein ACJRO7_001832 [Eucalyptus globulus]|uniref:Uncharacterized protein n=1 Tax=Eucalyptus globulus TaxID=34317 RepID=A0ABD3LXE9_EUCGL
MLVFTESVRTFSGSLSRKVFPVVFPFVRETPSSPLNTLSAMETAIERLSNLPADGGPDPSTPTPAAAAIVAAAAAADHDHLLSELESAHESLQDLQL